MKKIYLLLLLACNVSLAQDCNISFDDFSSYGCYNCSLVDVSADWISYYPGASDPMIGAGGSIQNPDNERSLDITSHFSQGNDTVVYDAIHTLSIDNPGIIAYSFDFYNECGRLYMELLKSFNSISDKEAINSIIIDLNEIITNENPPSENVVHTYYDWYRFGLEINFYEQRLNILVEDSLLTSVNFNVESQEFFGIAFGSNQCNYIDNICIKHSIIDLDGDGYDYRVDCDDNNIAINPGTLESPYNGLDDDCDPTTPDDDLDGDGFVIALDCDDENDQINPMAEEIPDNGIDEDCDGEDQTTTALHEPNTYSLSFYPNPANAFIVFPAKANTTFDVWVYSLDGKTLISESGINRLNLATLATGVYLLRIEDRKTKKLSFEKLLIN